MLNRSPFAGNVLKLVTGTGLAQVVPLLAAPILTRLYAPSDFGALAIYVMTVAIVSIFSSGRYELAAVLAESDREAWCAVNIAMAISLVMALTFLVGIILLDETLATSFFGGSLPNWVYLVPFSVLLVVLLQTYNCLLVRQAQFTALATNKLVVAIVNSLTQLGFGFLMPSGTGLIGGVIAGQIVSLIYLAVIYPQRGDGQKLHPDELRHCARKYKKFPLYDIPSTLFNVVANQVPIFLLGRYFGLHILGNYSFTSKILLMPVNLLSASYLDVFKQRASSDYLEKGNCTDIFKKSFFFLFAAGIAPFSILWLFGSQLFGFVFGSNWMLAGQFAEILAPMIFLKFIVSPLSYTFYIAHKQPVDLLLQIVMVLACVVAFSMGIYLNDAVRAVTFYTAAASVLYIVYLFYSYRFSKGAQ